MADASKCKSIVEVGCGPGFHSEFIAKNYLAKGSLLVSCDFSTSMIETLYRRYQQSDFTNNSGNRVHVDLETDHINSNETKVIPCL